MKKKSDAFELVDPPPMMPSRKAAAIRLLTLDDIRAEQARIYRRGIGGLCTMEQMKGAIWSLSLIGRSIEAGVIETKLQQIEALTLAITDGRKP
jgi:hypothetical protein